MELWQLQQKQSLPLEAKIAMTQQRIREWYEHWDGEVYVSFSGGKDSTVLLHIVRQMYPDVPAVFSEPSTLMFSLTADRRRTPPRTLPFANRATR